MKTGNHVRSSCTALAILAALLIPGQAALAADLIGAQKVLERLSKATDTNAPAAAPSEAAKAREALTNDLNSFKVARAGMEPEKAATTWLALFDRFWSLPPETSSRYSYNSYGDEGLSAATLIGALPEPAAWEALAAQVEKRTPKKEEETRELALRLLTDYLVGSTDKLVKDTAALETKAGDFERYKRENVMETVRSLRLYNQRRLQEGTPDSIVREFEKTLEIQKTAKQTVSVKVPDFVSLVGEKRAAELITAALETPGVKIKIPGGRETQALARRICLERIDKLLEPQWALVTSPDALSLYEALAKKFPAKDPSAETSGSSEFLEGFNRYSGSSYGDDSEKSSASWYYLMGLLGTNKVPEAMTFVTSLKKGDIEQGWMSSSRSWDRAQEMVPSPVLLDFCERLLKDGGDYPVYEPYIVLSLQLGKTNEMIQLLSAEVAKKDLTFEKRVKALENLSAGYLAADRVEDAVKELQGMLSLDTSKESATVQAAFDTKRMSIAVQLARLGQLLKQPKWTEQGVEAAENAYAKIRTRASDEPDYRTGMSLNEVLTILVKDQQYARVESNVVETIAEKLKPKATPVPDYYPQENLVSELKQLAEVYYLAGRYDEIVTLLEKAPWWGVKDLVGLPDNGCETGPSLFVMAAEGLRAAGRNDEAVTILKYAIQQSPGDDDAYKVLVKIAPANLMVWIDDLYKRDRFEERPLIWKASLLLKDNKLDDAEKVIREALRVDPTDGESKDGQRVLAYAVLADILEAKGKKEDAEFFRKVVEAVRIAEEGDHLTSAGLITQSLALYEKAQLYFADAYCVQWRLARRLDAIGKHEEAAKHYAIAFERMPEQFGQVASFCFGCEGAFQSGHSRSVAEKVLLGLEEKGPARPQVYYLLGQLREAQERNPEAYAYYKKAVAMDPDYLDVWKQIECIADGLFLPMAERDAIKLQMLRMDPLQRHSYGNLSEINDLKSLWGVALEAEKLNVKPPGSLLTLTASKAKLDEKKQGRDNDYDPYSYSRYGRYNRTQGPGEALAQNDMIQQIIRLMSVDAADRMQMFE